MQVLEDQGEEIEAAQTAAVASAAASEDLHASLEGQLRASHADVGRLQSEVKRLKAAAETAAAAAISALLLGQRVSNRMLRLSWKASCRRHKPMSDNCRQRSSP